MRWLAALAALGLLGLLARRAGRKASEPPASALQLSAPDLSMPRSRTSGLALDGRRGASAADRMSSAGPSASAAPATAGDPLRILDEIMRSGDDNDPRLDSAFNALSVEDKRALRARFRALPPENLNGRGTIVYLLGRNLASAEDWAFLREVVAQPPCLSLARCAETAVGGGAEGAGDEVTLAYPALVALKQAERVLRREVAGPGAAEARRGAVSVVKAAELSRAAIVARKAAELAARL